MRRHAPRAAWACVLLAHLCRGQTPTPTPAPTVACGRGKFLDGDSCEPCEAGKFRNATEAPAVCTLCPRGTFRGYSTDPDKALTCSDCPVGKLSTADRSECTDCDAGEYAWNDTACVACEAGTYAPVALTDACMSCAAGFATHVGVGATSCLACDAGTFAPASSSNCTACPAGKISGSGASSCTNCSAGFYSQGEGASACTACAAGYFSHREGASNCSACARGSHQAATGQSKCDECEAGMFADIIAAGTCWYCVAGKYSNASAATCSDCAPGEFSMNKASACSDCEAGKYSDASTDFVCVSCDGGMYSAAGARSCTNCSAGTFSGTGAAMCTTCPVGFFSEDEGAAVCMACAAGSFARDRGASNCSACEAGTSQPATSQSACTACEAGKFAASVGSSSCTACDAGKFSHTNATACTNCTMGSASDYGAHACTTCNAGSFSRINGASACIRCKTAVGEEYTSTAGSMCCDLCVAGYFWDARRDHGSECVACPDGTRCRKAGVTLETLEVQEGYFRFTTTSTTVYPCEYARNCRGGNMTDDADEQCARGAQGPLCTTCSVGFFLDAFNQACTECGLSAGSLIGPALGFGFLLLVVSTLLAVRGPLQEWAEGVYTQHRRRIDDVAELSTVVVVTMQILVLVQSNHLQLGGEELQSPFAGFLEAFGFLALDVVQGVPTSCVVQVSHYNFVVVWSLLPVAIFVVGAATLRRAKPQTRTAHLSLFVKSLFLVLPTISTTVFSTFRCTEYDAGDDGDVRFLAVDHEVDCDSAHYQSMVAFAVVAVLVYPVGVPLGLLAWLYRFRHRLDPPHVLEDVAIGVRNADATLIQDCAVANMALRHRPRYWFFEVYNMLRRLLLTSGSLVFDSVESMVLFILAVAIITTVIEREAQAHLNPVLDAFVYICSWQIVLVVIGMIAADAEMTSGVGTRLIGAMLLLLNLTIIGVVFVDTQQDIKRERHAATDEEEAEAENAEPPQFEGFDTSNPMMAHVEMTPVPAVSVRDEMTPVPAASFTVQCS